MLLLSLLKTVSHRVANNSLCPAAACCRRTQVQGSSDVRFIPTWAFVLIGLAALLPGPVLAQQLMAEGVGKMVLQTPKKPHSYTRVAFSDGTKAERFTLKAGDCVRSINDCRDDRERVEFSARNTGIGPGDTVWYAWSVYVPKDFPRLRQSPKAPNYTFGQIHQRDNSGQELLFNYFYDGFFAVLKNPTTQDDDPMKPSGGKIDTRLLSQDAMRGRWTGIKINAKWSRGADGFATVWVNGRKAWSYKGPTTNSNGELYFKYGLYRSFVSRCGGPCPDATVYYTNVRQGRSEVEVN